MDALALLCTLHAEGPTTLVRLRASGWSRIEDLLRSSALEIAMALELPIARAERMLREARQLADRMQTLEPEEEVLAPPAARTARVPTPAAFLASRRSDAAFGMGPQASIPGRRSEPSAPPEAPPAFSRRTTEDGSTDRQPDVFASRAEESRTDETGTPLEPELLDELDPELCRSLLDAGVRTVEDLIAASGLSLSRRTGVPFTRLLELQLRAQRVLEAATPPLPAAILFSPRRRVPGQGASDATTPRALQYRRFTDRAPARVELPPAEEQEAAGPFA